MSPQSKVECAAVWSAAARRRLGCTVGRRGGVGACRDREPSHRVGKAETCLRSPRWGAPPYGLRRHDAALVATVDKAERVGSCRDLGPSHRVGKAETCRLVTALSRRLVAVGLA